MMDIYGRFKEFNSSKGYFLSDKRTLYFLDKSLIDWSVSDINSKLGALGLHMWIPDTQLYHVLKILSKEEVRNAIRSADVSFFNDLNRALSFLKEAKFVASKFLCGHRPEHFPIWDQRKLVIKKWNQDDRNLSYEQLKSKIDSYNIEKGTAGVDYYMFNKLLWLNE